MTKPTKIHVKKALNDESSNADVNMEVTLQEEDIGSAPSSSNNDTANLQQDSQIKKRYVTRILAADVPGHNWEEKIKVISNGLEGTIPIIGIRSTFEEKKKYITISFATQEDAEKACSVQFEQDNEHTLQPWNKVVDDSQDKILIIRDIPLNVNRTILFNNLKQHGEITNIKYKLSGPWYTATVTYKSKDTIQTLKNTWSIAYMQDSLRIHPLTLTHKEHDIVLAVNAKTCFIPRTCSHYERARYAYVSFESEEKMQEACVTSFGIKGNEVFWALENQKICHKCGSPDHMIVECKEKIHNEECITQKEKFNNLYSKYNIKIGNNNKDKSYKKTNTNTSTRLYSDTVKNIKKITFGSHSNTPDTSSNKERTQNTQLQQLFSNIESKLKSVQETLNVLTNRINIIEEKIGIKKVISLPNQNQTKNLKTMHNIQHTGLHDISSDESTIHSEEEEINDIKQNKLQETMNDILKEIHSSSTMLFDNHQQETTQKQ
ncbi:4235_t:CDS:2 [Entrophospora sp. SA101]|nr:4235_t:CDS:2 [Entrophospora sp. SA101]